MPSKPISMVTNRQVESDDISVHVAEEATDRL
jgi:hypothetical protein